MREGASSFERGRAPDPAWRWDGHTWVQDPARKQRAEPEVAPVPPGTAALQSPTRPPHDAESGHEAQPPSSEATSEEKAATRHGWPTIGALIGASLVVLAVIIGAALLGYRAAGSPPANPVPAASGRPVDPNALSYRYLAGVTVAGLTGALKSDGFSCAPPAPPENNLRNWRCDRARGTQRDVVQIWAVDGDHVHLVEVTTVALSGSLDLQSTLQLNARMAQLVYGASTAQAAAAISWVNANPNSDATTDVGGITLRSDRNDVAALLAFDGGSRG